MSKEVINQVLEALISLVALIVTGVLIPEIKRWVSSKADNQTLQYVVNEVTQEATTVVMYLQQTMVSQLKADGEWDEAHQAEAFQRALELTLANLSMKAYKYFDKNRITAEEFVTHYIETAVLRLKG